MTSAPVIYLLFGDDELAIHKFVADLESKVGDPATGDMNISRLDGNSFNLDELLSVASAMPFLAKRRLVVLTEPLKRVTTPTAREKFKQQLEKIPPTTALVLVHYHVLTEERERKAGKLHWLEKWAEAAGERVLAKAFMQPRGAQLVRWIQDQAKEQGGQVTPQAAGVLAGLVGEDPRQAQQELYKLLAYVNYKRPVEVDDVELLTADTGQADIFEMVDALGERNSRKALGLMHRLMEQQDSFSIFGMIVRQFRLLLQARAVLDAGGQSTDVARALKVHPFVAGKVTKQAQAFTWSMLETVYHQLLELDEAMKTGEMEAPLVLDTLVATFTAAHS